jgi:hypothetical protein
MGPVSFLTPFAALVALVGLLPLAAFLRRERRAQVVRRGLGLGEPAPERAIPAALLAVSVLVGAAAVQPVIDRSPPEHERTDAEVFVALDTSRSMLAAESRNEPTRIDRARATALELRDRLPEIPMGVAQFTDWTSPHLFPTSGDEGFRLTLERAVFVDSLGARESSLIATDLDALAAFARESYFTPGVSKRLLVVLTDGESRPLGGELAALREAGISTVFVQVWGAEESIWRPSGAEPQYTPDPSSAQTLAQAGGLVDGAVFDEEELDGVVARVRAEVGDGPARPSEHRDLFALMPYVMLGALLPLGFLLRQRNL